MCISKQWQIKNPHRVDRTRCLELQLLTTTAINFGTIFWLILLLGIILEKNRPAIIAIDGHGGYSTTRTHDHMHPYRLLFTHRERMILKNLR